VDVRLRSLSYAGLSAEAKHESNLAQADVTKITRQIFIMILYFFFSINFSFFLKTRYFKN